MVKAPGVVFVNEYTGKSVFLTAGTLSDLDALISSVADTLTVAGPSIDRATLDELGRHCGSLADVDEDTAPTRLSHDEGECLEILCAQAGIRAALAVRQRRTCTVCGAEKIVDPARRKARATPEIKPDALVAGWQLSNDGHPLLAVLRVLGSAADSSRSIEAAAACERCDGADFTYSPVTFCPQCHSLRDELLLAYCPQCTHDFLPLAGHEFWSSEYDAETTFKISVKRAVFSERAKRFENGLWAGQKKWLMEHFTRDEKLLGMCRCGFSGQIGRYVALLFTTERISWARQSPMSSTSWVTWSWQSVDDVSKPSSTDSKYDNGLRVTLDNGDVYTFNDFRGSGVNLGDRDLEYDADSMRQLAERLWRGNYW